MTEFKTRYIGDGVYASCDGYHIILDLRAQDSTTRIALEPPVLDRLIKYRDDLLTKARGPQATSSYLNRPLRTFEQAVRDRNNKGK